MYYMNKMEETLTCDGYTYIYILCGTVWIKNVFPPESTHVYYVSMCRISTFMHVSTCINNNNCIAIIVACINACIHVCGCCNTVNECGNSGPLTLV